MESGVLAAVLAAAALHAGWNALVRSGADRFLSVVQVAFYAGLASCLLLPLFPLPAPGAWPWLLGSVVLHTGYKYFLSRAYGSGDLGQVYPLARGLAPLLVAGASLLFLREGLGPARLLGILVLAAGVWCMSLRGGRQAARPELETVLFALATSGFIAAYTLTDGLGARLAGTAHGYAVWLFTLDGLGILALSVAVRGRSSLGLLARGWRVGLCGGAASLAAYWLVIWAMTRAPIPLVAAWRETSVLFAAAISVVVLREPLTAWRVAAALLIAGGVALTRLGG